MSDEVLTERWLGISTQDGKVHWTIREKEDGELRAECRLTPDQAYAYGSKLLSAAFKARGEASDA